MEVYLIDGTYELFRHFFALPSVKDANGQEIGAARAVVNSVRRMIEHQFSNAPAVILDSGPFSGVRK